MAQADIVALTTLQDGVVNWGNLMRGAMSTLAGVAEAPWQTWTPLLTAVTTNPTLGTGSAANGLYVRIGTDLIVAQFEIAFGTSGVNAGSGVYDFSLPVASAERFGSNSRLRVGRAVGFDSSATAMIDVVLSLNTSTTCRASYAATWPSGGITAFTNAAPWTWAASDSISGWLLYEAA